MTTKPEPSPSCMRWMEKLKRTNLRTWLNLAEIEALITEQKKPTKVWVTAQARGGIRTLAFKLNSIEKRITEAEGSKDVLKDLVINASMIIENKPDHDLVLKASAFIPDPNHPLADLTRMFKQELHRDHFVEDVMFLVDISEQDTLAMHQRFANSLFRKFFDGSLGDGPEEQH